MLNQQHYKHNSFQGRRNSTAPPVAVELVTNLTEVVEEGQGEQNNVAVLSIEDDRVHKQPTHQENANASMQKIENKLRTHFEASITAK